MRWLRWHRTPPARRSPLAMVGGLTYSARAIRPTRRPGRSLAIGHLFKAVGKVKLAIEGNTFAADVTESIKKAADRSPAQFKGATEGGVSACA